MKDLSGLNKENPFKVPENYFESISDEILERINIEEQPPKREIMPILKPYLYMVASIASVVLIIKLVLTISVDPQYKIQTISQVDTPSVTIQNAIPNQYSEEDIILESSLDSSADDIIEYLSEETLDTDIIIANL